jgi:hypothetical protein
MFVAGVVTGMGLTMIGIWIWYYITCEGIITGIVSDDAQMADAVRKERVNAGKAEKMGSPQKAQDA